MASLSQVQAAVNYANAYGTPGGPLAGVNGDPLVAALNGTNPSAVLLQALGYYNGPLTATYTDSTLRAAMKSYLMDSNQYDAEFDTPRSSIPGANSSAWGWLVYLQPAVQQALAGASSNSAPGNPPIHGQSRSGGASSSGGASDSSGGGGFLSTTQGKLVVGGGLLAAALVIAKSKK